MKVKIPHPHAGILAEAIQDAYREIQGKLIKHDSWVQVTIGFVASANALWEFRFTDTMPKIVSSMTDDEISAVVDKYNDTPDDVPFSTVMRAVADAAAAKHEADLAAEKQPSKTGDNSSLPHKMFNKQDVFDADETAVLFNTKKFRLF